MCTNKLHSTIPKQQRAPIICRLAPSSTIWSTLQVRSQGLELKATRVYDQLVWCLGCILFQDAIANNQVILFNWFKVQLGSPASTLVESPAVWIPSHSELRA